MRRHRALERLGVDVDNLPHSFQRLLLEPRRSLTADDRQRIVRVMVRRDLDLDPICGVLQVIGDTRIGLHDVQALVADAHRQREPDKRPGENFSVSGVVRHEHAGGPRYHVTLVPDDQAGGFIVEVGLSDLKSAWQIPDRLHAPGQFPTTLQA